MNSSRIRRDLLRIWNAGIAAVDCRQLVRDAISISDDSIDVAGSAFSLGEIDRIVVVGAGKAAAHMVLGLEDEFDGTSAAARLSGWVNVPDNCIFETSCIHLHPARPAGINEPTKEAVNGTDSILKQVSALSERDLCIVILTGGGSALLAAPVEDISLDDKILGHARFERRWR